MTNFCKKHRKLIRFLVITFLLYCLLPCLSTHSAPFKLFSLRADKIDSLSVRHGHYIWETDNPEEIAGFVNKMNKVGYFWWFLVPPSGGTEYAVHVYYDSSYKFYDLSYESMRGSWIVILADLQFLEELDPLMWDLGKR